ncbi:MAG: type III-B CRISPR module-associated protein Cmr3 [Candidatus Obscuribacterales bacterium]|nr:type III-B CRISPR module-associated protein Cmr3 [Candidatus Obscuribacterales bacterium]
MTATLALIPRDGIFCKDGRGWYTSESGRGHALDWPWPSSILGAVRTAWGCQYEDILERPLSPSEWIEKSSEIFLNQSLILRRKHNEDWHMKHRIWSAPYDAIETESNKITMLSPQPPKVQTLGRDDDSIREALWVPSLPSGEKPLPRQRWWTEQQFIDWLCEEPQNENYDRPELSRRIQAHVSIDPKTLAAKESVLFCHDVIETMDTETEWAIGVSTSIPSTDADRITSSKFSTFGGDSRLVRWERIENELFTPPARLLKRFESGTQGLRLIAATPLCFERGWLPDSFDCVENAYRGRLLGLDFELILRAAFIPRAVHVSGWDMARRLPKPTSSMVAPGAVYFFERADAELFTKEHAEALWFCAAGKRTDEGFGRVIPGIWTPTRTQG